VSSSPHTPGFGFSNLRGPSPLVGDPQQAHVHNRMQDVTSRTSYYSASEIPLSSPLPSPVYRYPSGEVTSTPPPARRPSTSTRAASPQQSSPPQYATDLVRSLSGSMVSGAQLNPGAYEMRVRSPPRDLLAPSPQHEPRGGSDSSFATAQDSFSDGSESQTPRRSPQPSNGGRQWLHPQSVDAGYDEVGLEGSASDHHQRQTSDSSWHGGTAL